MPIAASGSSSKDFAPVRDGTGGLSTTCWSAGDCQDADHLRLVLDIDNHPPAHLAGDRCGGAAYAAQAAGAVRLSLTQAFDHELSSFPHHDQGILPVLTEEVREALFQPEEQAQPGIAHPGGHG